MYSISTSIRQIIWLVLASCMITQFGRIWMRMVYRFGISSAVMSRGPEVPADSKALLGVNWGQIPE
jgi:hypothetical protein